MQLLEFSKWLTYRLVVYDSGKGTACVSVDCTYNRPVHIQSAHQFCENVLRERHPGQTRHPPTHDQIYVAEYFLTLAVRAIVPISWA